MSPEFAPMSGSKATEMDRQQGLALIAKAADFQLVDEFCTEPTGEPLGFREFRTFALEVWRSEGRTEPLFVNASNSAGLRHRIPLAFRDQAAWAVPAKQQHLDRIFNLFTAMLPYKRIH